MTPEVFRPTPAQITAANGRTIPDVLRRGLKVVFCGINPSLYSAAVGHHFGRPGNRFWPALHAAGVTDRLLSPFEDGSLPQYGCGLTNLVARATAAAEELGDEELVVLADRRRLQQLLRNLLANAIRFSPTGGLIELSASLADDGSVLVEVADRGPGIPPEELDTIFERHRQVGTDRTGLGLGLYIARRIVEAHGGRLWAESTLGQGSTFLFTVPAYGLEHVPSCPLVPNQSTSDEPGFSKNGPSSS